MMATTGPKISSRTMRMSVRHASKMVGIRNAPRSNAAPRRLCRPRRAPRPPTSPTRRSPAPARAAADHQRADLRLVVRRIAHTSCARRGDESSTTVVDRALDKDAAPRAAILAGVVETDMGACGREPFSRSASAKTMLGLLPPSSREIFFMLSAASRMISWPVVVSPVKAILPMPGCAAMAAPPSHPGRSHVHHARRKAGLQRQFAQPIAVSGVHAPA